MAILMNSAKTIKLIDEVLQRPVGTNQYSEGVDNINKLTERPTGTSRGAGLRRLRKDRPDLLRDVIAG